MISPKGGEGREGECVVRVVCYKATFRRGNFWSGVAAYRQRPQAQDLYGIEKK